MAGLLDILNRNPGLLSPLPSQSALGPGIGQAKALLAQPAPVVAAPVAAPARVNPLRVAFSTLFDGTNPFTAYDEEKMRPAMQARAAEKLALERQAQRNLLGMFGGGPAAAPVGIMRTPETPAFTGAPMAGAPTMAGAGRLPSIQAAGPALAAAQLAGIEGVGGLRELITAAQPDIQIGPDGQAYDANDPSNLTRRFGKNENINGFVTDVNDPNNRNLYRPDLAEGQEPVYDAQGRVVGVRNIDGSVQAEATRVRAVADANRASEASYAGAIAGGQAAGRAPYEIERVAGPNGETITTNRASLLNGGAISSQTPVQAVIAEGNARNQVGALEDARTRASASTRVLPQLDNMEKLLKDINSGFGANTRTGIDRFAAALPLGPLNDDAQRRASATQTFQGEARQVVAGILPLFGANPTEGERKYAEQMSGADVTYTPEAIQEGIRLARARAVRDRANYEALRAQTGSQNRPAAAQPTAAEARAILRSRGVPGY